MSDVKPVACGKDFFARLNEKLKHIRNQAVRLPRSADGTIGSTMQFVRKEHAALQAEIEALRKDAERMDWIDAHKCAFDHIEWEDYRHYSDPSDTCAARVVIDAAIAKEKQQ